VHVPGYYHQGLVLEKQHFLDGLLRRLAPGVRPFSVLVHEGPSPVSPWESTILSDPLDDFGDFDALWDVTLDALRNPLGKCSTKLQNVMTDGFTVFAKDGGSRSSWYWTKYKLNKYKEEDMPKVGPAVEHSIGEIVAEHYSAWRELRWRSYIVLHRNPLRIEFRGESVSGAGPRMTEPNPVLYFGLLTIFGKMCEKKYLNGPPATHRGVCCRRRRAPAATAAAEAAEPARGKEKDE